MKKFLKKDRILSSTTEKHDSLSMPLVTVCQENGYKYQALKELGEFIGPGETR